MHKMVLTTELFICRGMNYHALGVEVLFCFKCLFSKSYGFPSISPLAFTKMSSFNKELWEMVGQALGI